MELNFLTAENFELFKLWAINVAVAILMVVVGFAIARWLTNLLGRQLDRNRTDPTVVNFARSMVGTGLKILVLLIAAGQVGIETTSIIAIIGALAFAIGFALQGTLGHFASGVMLLFFRPYKVGDLVTIGGGQTGTVEELQIFNTILLTLDNKKIIIPNGTVADNIITNISGQGIIGVELTYGIGYNDSIDQAREVILRVGRECPTILDDPAQTVVVASHGDSSVNLATRPFCRSEDYWTTFFYMQEHVKKAFDAADISIPYPQMDVHLDKVGSAEEAESSGVITGPTAG